MIKGFTCSTFDLLHAGHVAMLKEAREQCDYLTVGLQTDPTLDRKEKNKPVQEMFERYWQLKGCKYVDEIIPYSTEKDLLNLLHIIKPNIRIVGEEYKDRPFTGKELCPVYYNSRTHGYSSSELRSRL